MSKDKKIVRVGIDPFSDNLENLERVKTTVNALNLEGCRLIPTYLLDFQSEHWYEEMPPSMQESIKNSAARRIENQLQSIEVKGWEKPQVFTSQNLSRREKISYLADLLNEEKCDLFIANTHARKGLSRLFMGSFAENLLLKSQTPLLFVSPKTNVGGPVEKVLFPTNFSDSSFEVLQSFLNSPFGQVKEVEVYSMTLYYSSVATLGQFGGSSSVENFIHEANNQKKEKFKVWQEKLKEKNVKLSCEIEDKVSGLTQAIFQKTEASGAELIVMGSFVGKNEVIFSGSHTRDVVRNSHLPVLVWHFEEEQDEEGDNDE